MLRSNHAVCPKFKMSHQIMKCKVALDEQFYYTTLGMVMQIICELKAGKKNQ